nr:Sm1=nuclease [Serratia marcescens, Peptide Partial, 15 aa] [Serratia marcescens]
GTQKAHTIPSAYKVI